MLQENASKNAIMKILSGNQNHLSSIKVINSSQSFKTASTAFRKNHHKPKLQRVDCGNHYDSVYQTDDSDKSYSSSDTISLSTGSDLSIENSKQEEKFSIKNRKKTIMEIVQSITETRIFRKKQLISLRIKLSTKQCKYRNKKQQK